MPRPPTVRRVVVATTPTPGGVHMKRLPARVSLLVAFTVLAPPGLAGAAPFQIVEATIAEIHAQYRAGKLSPEDVVRMYRARIDAFDRTAKPQPLNGGA